VGAVLLGLLIASAFGSGDFVGGRASASASTSAVVVVSQACSVVGALVLALVVSATVATHDLTYGALAGAANVVGLALLYDALSRHAAGVVAPMTAVVGAVVPVAWGLAHGERPSGAVLAGITLAIVAGALIAAEPGAGGRRALARGVPEAVVAGFALGSSLVLYAQTSERSGQYPVLAARLTALALAVCAIAWLARRAPIAFPRGPTLALAVAAGAFDITATALLVVAVRQDLLSVVAPVVSLAPAFTVVLAWWLSGEHLRAVQRAGFVVALAGLILVAAG
jgi:uncharacterized membrane protein